MYTSPFLDTDDLKIALRARKFSGAFEKRAPGAGAGAMTVKEFGSSLEELREP